MTFVRSFVRPGHAIATLFWCGLVPTPGRVVALAPPQTATPYAVLTTDVHASVNGGLDTGTAVGFLAELGVDLDMGELVGWEGATVHASGFAIANNDRFTGDLLGHYSEISNIAAFETVRLFRVHVEQSFRGGDLTVKVGQLALDDDFMGSDRAALFINAAFGPLSTESANLAAPIFPVGALGVFARAAVSDDAWLQAGAYDGDSGSEEGNRHGLDIHLDGDQGATVLLEAGRAMEPGGQPGVNLRGD